MKEFIREEERGRDRLIKYPFSLGLLSLFAVLRLGALVIGFLLLLPQEPHSKRSYLIGAEQTALSGVSPCPHHPILCGSLDKEEMCYLWE